MSVPVKDETVRIRIEYQLVRDLRKWRKIHFLRTSVPSKDFFLEKFVEDNKRIIPNIRLVYNTTRPVVDIHSIRYFCEFIRSMGSLRSKNDSEESLFVNRLPAIILFL